MSSFESEVKLVSHFDIRFSFDIRGDLVLTATYCARLSNSVAVK